MTDELKELLKKATSEEEAKAILDAHSDKLSDEELDQVAGGTLIPTYMDCIQTVNTVNCRSRIII